ncbi:MAG TPA: FAD-dependent oxidoreductase [Myxococcota bacterium]|nr:FAD-dependent oxidoreductase [Myxococcota bacterium]
MAEDSAAIDGTGSRVVVVGGGLAGMTVANELGKRGVSVLLLEGSDQLGGKAGSKLYDGMWLDHGYHVFPGWYVNARKLLSDLGAAGHLIDIDRVHYVRRGEFPLRHTLYAVTNPRNLWSNLWSGLVPWYDAILASYFALDLSSTSFNQRSFLDRVSANGFLRSRLYATEGVAEAHHHFVLQAASIPNYEISAMTAKRITASWFRIPNPIFSILDGDLQRTFIDPFTRSLEKHGVEVQRQRVVVELRLDGRRVSELRLHDGEIVPIRPGDRVVLTTPHGMTHALVSDSVFEAERSAPQNVDEKLLSDLVHLRSAPMAALHVFFKRRIPEIPREHTVLVDSSFELSFVDVSQHWPGCDVTMLSCIASEFAPVAALSTREMRSQLLGELLVWLNGVADMSDVDLERTRMFPNVTTPLFLNTVGAWSYRPNTRTRLENLYVAGDWCRARVDLTTMEGAISSGLSTAGRILRDLEVPGSVEPIEVPEWPEWMLRSIALVLLPGILALKGGLWLRARFLGRNA